MKHFIVIQCNYLITETSVQRQVQNITVFNDKFKSLNTNTNMALRRVYTAATVK